MRYGGKDKECDGSNGTDTFHLRMTAFRREGRKFT